MFGVELLRSLHRPRTYVLGVLLAAVAVLPVVVLVLTSGGGGPPFFQLIRQTGLSAPLAAIVAIQPVILPLGVSLLAGETVAGEAAAGTLRYLLVRPVGRTALVVQKYLAVMTVLALAVLWVIVVSLIAGGIAFGMRSLPTLSGSTLGVGTGLLRIAGSGAYVVLELAGLVAVGVFASVWTESPIGAGAITLVVSIASQILDALSSLNAIHPYLLTHDWLAFSDLLRSPVAWGGIEHGLWVTAVYVLVFLGGAVAAFRSRDVTA